MADDSRSTDETRSKAGAEESPVAKAAAAGTPVPENELSAAEALKKGMGFLWQAAQTAADEIQREVELTGVKDSLRQAGEDLEHAAKEAARVLEDFIERGPGDPKPDYTDEWPPPNSGPPAGARAKQVDADIPKEGGTDEEGRRRDVRIQLEDD